MTERERLEKLMQRLDRATAEAFLAYVSTMKSPEMIREVERLIATNRINDAIDLVDSHIRRFAAVIPRNYTLVGNSTVDSLEPTMRRLRPRIAITFDPAYPRAAEQVRRQVTRLVGDISTSQRESIRNALSEAFSEGAGPRQASRAYRDAIGLTDTQRQAVKRYRELLDVGSKEALTRGLRDKRYTNVENLDPGQIDRMVDAYERKYVKYRADTIARTETTETLNAANDEAFQQMLDQTGIGDEWIERTWQSTRDSRTRDSHKVMHTRVVHGMSTPFVTGLGNRALRPGDPMLPADDKINCRCVATNRILRADEVADPIVTA